MQAWVRRSAAVAGLAMLLGASGRLAAAEPSDDALRRAVAVARDRVTPALVNILVVDRYFSQGRESRSLSAGSGVIVSPAGHVLTNHHVAGEAVRIRARLGTGEIVRADIVCADPLTDLCVLKLRLNERVDASKPLSFAGIGDSDRLQVGDHVMALGNPMSLSDSITLGIVSNIERVFTSFSGDRIESLELGGGQQTGIFNRWIQHDALILPGNSGGPLVNLAGQIVGINTRGGGGVAFAIPASTCRLVLNQALTFGEVRRGWLGLAALPVTNLDRNTGALVSSVLEGAPAYEAGIRPGDIVLSIGGTDISILDLDEVPLFLARIAELRPGRPAPIVYERAGERIVAQVTPSEMEPMRGVERVFRTWGVSAMSITAPMAVANGWPDTRGVLLRTLKPGDPPNAAKPSLQSGDVLLEVAGKAVDGLDVFGEVLLAHKEDKVLPVRFRRDGEDMITVLDMSKKPRRRGTGELGKAWLGVSTQVLTTKMAEALGMADRKGFRVTRVLPTTEAEKAGLKVGDILLAIDGEALEASQVQDAEILKRRIELKDIGSTSILRTLREGAELDVSVVLQETPGTAADAKTAEDELLEYNVRELTFTDRIGKDLPPDFRGLLVSDAEDGGWASVAGLSAGDVLLSLQGVEVSSIAEFKDAMERLHKERPERVRWFVRRGRSTTFVFAQPEWPRDDA